MKQMACTTTSNVLIKHKKASELSNREKR